MVARLQVTFVGEKAEFLEIGSVARVLPCVVVAYWDYIVVFGVANVAVV